MIALRGSEEWGTLGCLVRWKGQVSILSSGHVLTRFGNAYPGDSIVTPAGEVIANLTAAVAPLPDDDTALNRLDVGLAVLADPGSVSAGIGNWGPPRTQPADARLSDVVYIWGGKSPRRNSVVRQLGVPVSLPRGPLHHLHYQDLVRCDVYSQKGDSGAVVLNGGMHVVGLHVGSDEAGSYFCPISNILDHWPGLTFVSA